MKCLTGKTSGTCIPECPYYSQCHCGCGKPARVYAKHTSQKFTKGHYCINANGHHANRARTHAYSKSGIEAARLQPLAQFLRREAGGRREAAALTGLPRPTFYALLYGKYDYTAPQTAERVVATVLAVRSRRDPDAWHQPRLATAHEQHLAPDPLLIRNRDLKRQSRAKERTSA